MYAGELPKCRTAWHSPTHVQTGHCRGKFSEGSYITHRHLQPLAMRRSPLHLPSAAGPVNREPT